MAFAQSSVVKGEHLSTTEYCVVATKQKKSIYQLCNFKECQAYSVNGLHSQQV